MVQISNSRLSRQANLYCTIQRTLRKTFGYHQRVTFGAGIPELMEMFNHSNQKADAQLSVCAAGRGEKSIHE